MKTLAIIGVGPRGLYALENVLFELSKQQKQVRIIAFEPCDEPGSGQVWYTGQSDSNWVNISERALKDLKGRPEIKTQSLSVSGFPSYHDWANFSQTNLEADTFPPRHKIGHYLYERYKTLATALKDYPFKCYKTQVNAITFDKDNLIVKTNQQDHSCDDVLITIGHQPTKLSDQINDWKSHASNTSSIHVFENSYPLSQFDNIKQQCNLNIGIRGFGLAMIDVMRAFTMTNFGKFKTENTATFKCTYQKSKDQNLKLIPFSLDGLPMAPKPLNASIDNWYKPDDSELKDFKAKIEAKAQTNIGVNSLDFLVNPMAKIIARIYTNLGTKAIKHKLDLAHLETVILIWFKNPEFMHDILLDNSIETYDMIHKYINMALGKDLISLDYCIGQVWRHCQPTLYKSLSHAQLENELMEDIITLDEQTKRFSYGPPIESMQQLLALVDANVLTLDFVNDPDIDVVNDGWKLTSNSGTSITPSVMVNSVLDAPKLLDVNSPIIKSLLHNDIVEPIHSDLGIHTKTNGYVVTEEGQRDIPVAVLGRLAKGSVIGVDAILECFGSRIETWAKDYVNQL